jgi:hypothetical protein
MVNETGAGEQPSGDFRAIGAVGGVLLRGLARPRRPALTRVTAILAREARAECIGSIAGTDPVGWLNAPLGLDGPDDGAVTHRPARGGAAARAAVPVSRTSAPFGARAARLVAGRLRDGGRDGVQESKR